MSEVTSPSSEKMDISDVSDESSHENTNTSQVLRLSNPITSEILDNERLDNIKYDHNNSVFSDRNISTTKNATNSHPLMYSPTSPKSSDFPDLIPEKPKAKKPSFLPQAHSTALENSTESHQFEYHFNIDLPMDEYNEKLPDFPDSPSALKKSLMYDLPVEMVAHDIPSDNENENDKSIYEAHLSSNLQNVSLTMNEKEGNLNFLAHNKRSNKLRIIKVLPIESDQESDVSSLDSNPDSLKSEDVFNGETENGKDNLENDDNISPEPIEPLSAADERRHARYWQRMVLPGGEQRTIDMRVIEPYKRVLSHGGYLRAGGHTAIVLFSACFLPDRSRVDYDYVMDNLFLYVLWTLERLVTEDYVLVYLHGAAAKLPSFSWLKRCYQMIGRKLRKNLSHLYIVHPTLWIKTMLFMAKPFISSKFYRKITFVATLRELMIRVPLEAAAIPDKVKAYDSLHCSA
ncbi:protein prune homolog 2 [Anoplophora glabripennis]|uniref:protein prune homolog 2 n=1 Tax=Anoplophora glabripennis TaxID=217634 RepID=UPI000875303E|nr:protein prune homolog 2 [Anoplophora glabripennis]